MAGEGIYFAAKSGRMCAETIIKCSEKGTRMIEAPRRCLKSPCSGAVASSFDRAGLRKCSRT